MGRGQDTGGLLTELGRDGGLVEVLGGQVAAGLTGLLQLPHQPVPVVLGPAESWDTRRRESRTAVGSKPLRATGKLAAATAPGDVGSGTSVVTTSAPA